MYKCVEYNSHLEVDGRPHPAASCWLERQPFPQAVSDFVEAKWRDDHTITPAAVLALVKAQPGWAMVQKKQASFCLCFVACGFLRRSLLVL
jgi:hypothetical protein